MERRCLSVSEFEKLRKAVADKRSALILDILYETSITVNELVNIKFKDIDFKQKILKILSQNTKSKKPRKIKISSRLCFDIKQLNTKNYLFKTRQSQKTTPRRIQQLLLSLGKKTGLGIINPSIIRKSSIAHSLLRKIPVFKIEKKTGIKNLQSYVYDLFKLKKDLLQ